MATTISLTGYWDVNITDNALCGAADCYEDMTNYQRNRIEGIFKLNVN